MPVFLQDQPLLWPCMNKMSFNRKSSYAPLLKLQVLNAAHQSPTHESWIAQQSYLPARLILSSHLSGKSTGSSLLWLWLDSWIKSGLWLIIVSSSTCRNKNANHQVKKSGRKDLLICPSSHPDFFRISSCSQFQPEKAKIMTQITVLHLIRNFLPI